MNSLYKKILPFLNEYIPEDLALKGISKIDPKMGNFLKRGLSLGLPLAGGLSFLKSNLSVKKDVNRSMRPDELAREEKIRQSRQGSETLKGIANLGLGLAGGSIAGKLAASATQSLTEPQVEPEESKRREALEEFNKKIRKQPLTEELQDQFNQAYGEQPSQPLNIIAQYSPELHRFLEEQITQGRSPEEAGALAYLQNNFKKVISKLEQDYRSPFSKILSSIYGIQQQPSQQTTQQGGQGQAALIEAIQKLRQLRGK